MSNWQDSSGQLTIQRPGKALTRVMIGLFLIWLMFAVAVNWADASPGLFFLFCGNTDLILEGQIWRLVTAPLMHEPRGSISHILFALMGLFFLTPALEQRWGAPRLLRFLFFSGVIAYGFQVLVSFILPATTSAKLVPQYWYGAFPIIEAVAVAWALSFKGQTVRLMFIFPVSSTALLWFVVGTSALYVVAMAQMQSGLLAPFGGMLAGWLLGAGTPSPLRKAYLKFRLRQVENEAKRERRDRQRRVKSSGLNVIEGGRSASERSASEHSGSKQKDRGSKKGPDGRYLN